MLKKNIGLLIVLLVLVGGTVLLLALTKGQSNGAQPVKLKSGLGIYMTITSSAFKPNESIPPRYTCDGENISPALEFFEVPENTQSLALIVDDPDAPAGTWTHWIVWNINPGIKQITEGATPLGATEGTTSFGKPGYGGPCPPSGQHRYVFKLYALDTVLDLKPSANVAALQSALSSHTIGQAQLMGRYRRQ